MEKDVIIGKMIVKKWIVTTKEKAMKYPDIPGYRIVLPENKVPLISFRGKRVRKEDMMSIDLIMLTQRLSSSEIDEYKFG